MRILHPRVARQRNGLGVATDRRQGVDQPLGVLQVDVPVIAEHPAERDVAAQIPPLPRRLHLAEEGGGIGFEPGDGRKVVFRERAQQGGLEDGDEGVHVPRMEGGKDHRLRMNSWSRVSPTGKTYSPTLLKPWRA